MDLVKGQHYEVVHPVTGRTEVWTGERIEAYRVNNPGTIVDFPPKKKPRVKKSIKTTKK